MIHNAVALVNGKGGVGKTSVAANFAALAAVSGWKTLAVDLDPQGNLQQDLGYRSHPAHDHGEALMHALVTGKVLSPVLMDVRPGLDVIPSGQYTEHADAGLARNAVDPRQLAASLAPLAASYDLIVLDCPPAGGTMTTLAMGAARGLVIPVKSDDASLVGLELVARQFQRVKAASNVALAVLGVVLFDVGTGASAIREEVRRELVAALGEIAPVFHAVIRHSERAARDMRRAGELAHEYEVGAAGSKRERLKALRQGSEAMGRMRRFSSSANGLAEDYAQLAEEILARLAEVQVADAP